MDQETGIVATALPTVRATACEQVVSIAIGGMTCGACAARIERRLNDLDGIEATVNYASERARVTLPADLSVDRASSRRSDRVGYSADVVDGDVRGPPATGEPRSTGAYGPCAADWSSRPSSSCPCATPRSPSRSSRNCGSPAGSG